jgi:uncharacterized protein YfaS (alpha-2-macroglobulin family)
MSFPIRLPVKRSPRRNPNGGEFMHSIPILHPPENQATIDPGPARSRARAILPVLIAAVLLVTCGAVPDPSGTPADSAPDGPYDPDWEEVEALVRDQKLEAASSLVAEIREFARERGHQEPWTRALVEEVRLRTALHGYETAVRFLREQPWPDDPLWRAVLELHYARSLATYFRQYGYEIRRREHVAGDEDVDLKLWTKDQIAHQANLAFQRAWADRGTWGARSLGSLSQYIVQNDYPARIRGTLRDAVTYMWVELLEDRGLWRAAHDNEMFLLDKEALIRGGEDGGIDPADPDAHPLRRICAILDDLQRWHEDHGRAEAALETRLVRLRILFAAFDQETDKQAVIDHLAGVLDEFDDAYDWWSMGQWQLAELLQEGPGDDRLAAAHRTAIAGRDRHLDSLGGQRCAHLVARLEAPFYNLRAMNADAAHRRSIQITHRNLAHLHFRAWRIDLADLVESLGRHGSFRVDRDTVRDWIDNREPDLVWAIDLPPTPDFEQHRTYTTLPADRKGAYVAVASVRRDFSERLNDLGAINMIVTDLVLVVRNLAEKMEVSALSGATGSPVAGVTVDVYRDRDRSRRRVLPFVADETVETDERGLAFFDIPGRPDRVSIFASKGEDMALNEGAHAIRRGEPRETTRSFVYTDRSIYRPGQTLNWEVVAYGGGGGAPEYRTLPDEELVVTLLDANGREVAADTLQTNSFGSASGSFVVPFGRLLGSWQVKCSLNGYARVAVEEYKRPTFEVTISDPASPLRLNELATLTGRVDYYFGLPVTSGDVVWRIQRSPRYPRWWWWLPRAGGPQIVASGRTALAEDGVFSLSFTPLADEQLSQTEGVSYNYELSVDVTDEGGETRSAQRNFRVGFNSVAATIESATDFTRAGAPVGLTVKRTNLDGATRPGEGTWRLVALEQPEQAVLPADLPPLSPPGEDDAYRTAGDLLNPRWYADIEAEKIIARWPDGRRIDGGTLTHDESGAAAIELTDLAAGAYRLHYETLDDFGATCRARHDFLVADRRATPLALPLILRAERTSAAVGDTARLFVHSGLPAQQMILELIHDGRRFGRQVLVSGRDPELMEIPIGIELRGGFAVRLVALRDFQLLQSSVSIFVPWDDRELKVEFATFRDRLRPGTDETFRVTVRDAAGQPDERLVAAGAAELLAYMYDRSLDVFAQHNPPRPITLYPRLTYAPQPWHSLGQTGQHRIGGMGYPAPPAFPRLHEDRLRALSGYGIGGMGVAMRAGELYVRGGRSGDVSMRIEELPDEIISDGVAIPVLQPFEVEGARYMVEVKSAVAEQRLGSEPFQRYAIDSAEDALAKQAGAPPAEPVEPRTNFAETAFFLPHLLLDADGAAIIEFKVPDSVTDWNVWVHAVTRDLRSGSAHAQAASVKELMVRPYLPRFLREGDRAELKVVVNNAGEAKLSGRLDFELCDPDTDADLRGEFGLNVDAATGVPFAVEAGRGVDLVFPVTAPARVGAVACRVTARAGDLSDGEQRPLPVLPGRLHLVQSRFACLREGERRELTFAELAADDDPSRSDEQLVVTVDAQLFYGVLNALPYLIEYPYECTEQLLNRFISTGILTSLFDEYPAVAAMARELSARETRLESWQQDDPNRKLLLEESPWLVAAEGGDRGGSDTPNRLIKALDPKIARVTREASLAKLHEAQSVTGGFPWWPGGRPSAYMTLYVLHGLANGLEFGVDAPRDMVQGAWLFMQRHYYEENIDDMVAKGCCWETITFLNYVLSCYLDEEWTGGVFTADDRARMLDFSFAHWRQHSPLLKGYLTLTLARAGREDGARLVFDSIMDSAKSDSDLGTYWAPEDRAWLWYNDTVDSHAFALRVLMELAPADARRHGLVQWLLLNKKLNHWRSTRTTAEVIYALVHYLEREGALGARETVRVAVGSRTREFVFEPDEYTGAHNRLTVPGNVLDPATMSTVVVAKEGPGTAFASATWHFSTDRMPAAGEGDLFAVERRYFRRHNDGDKWVLTPLAEGAILAVGDQVEVQLAVTARHAAEYVHLRDPRGAGFEPESPRSGYRWDQGIGCYEEVRDSGANFFFDWLPAGQYTFKYRLRANLAGVFKVGPAVLQSLYAPEFVAYSAGRLVKVE